MFFKRRGFWCTARPVSLVFQMQMVLDYRLPGMMDKVAMPARAMESCWQAHQNHMTLDMHTASRCMTSMHTGHLSRSTHTQRSTVKDRAHCFFCASEARV